MGEDMSTGFRSTVQVIALVGLALLANNRAGADPRTPPRVDYLPTPDVPMDVWLPRLVGSYSFEGAVEVVYDHPDYVEHLCGSLPPKPDEYEVLPPTPILPYCSDIKGAGDCIAIGNGPGLQCILNVSWQNFGYLPGGNVLAGGVSYLGPAMELFGMDPGRLMIRHLLVDSKGLPEGGAGVIKGNRATFKTVCVDSPEILEAMPPLVDSSKQPQPPYYHSAWRTCDRIVRIDVAPGSRVVHMSIDINLNGELFTRIEMTMRRKAQPASVSTGGEVR
jgi:hypothetical protein